MCFTILEYAKQANDLYLSRYWSIFLRNASEVKNTCDVERLVGIPSVHTYERHSNSQSQRYLGVVDVFYTKKTVSEQLFKFVIYHVGAVLCIFLRIEITTTRWSIFVNFFFFTILYHKQLKKNSKNIVQYSYHSQLEVKGKIGG